MSEIRRAGWKRGGLMRPERCDVVRRFGMRNKVGPMENMETIARDLVAALAKLDPPPDPMFRGPAQEGAIRQAQVELGVALDRELIDFLMCIDGQEPEGSAAIYNFPGDPIVPRFRFGPEPVHLSAWGWLLGIERIVDLTLWYRDRAEEN